MHSRSEYLERNGEEKETRIPAVGDAKDQVSHLGCFDRQWRWTFGPMEGVALEVANRLVHC